MDKYRAEESRQRSNLYAITTTLMSLVLIVALGYGAYWVVSKVLPVLGFIYLILLGAMEVGNLMRKEKYEEPKSLRQGIKDVIKKTMAENEKMTEEDATTGAYTIMVFVVAVMFFHYVLSTILMYKYGTANPFEGAYVLGILGLVATLLQGLRAMNFVKVLYKALKDTDKPIQRSKGMFFLGVFIGKTRALVTLAFMVLYLAANFGLVF